MELEYFLQNIFYLAIRIELLYSLSMMHHIYYKILEHLRFIFEIVHIIKETMEKKLE